MEPTEYDKLYNICTKRLGQLAGVTDDHKKRLALELKEVNGHNESEYFLSLTESGEKYDNENNLLIPYLLGVCEDFDISKPPHFVYGEYPDIDIDYLPIVRTYLKEQYSREQFGDDYVCNIATYTTFGLRSALIDMAKVFDLDRKEILALTTRLGIKDDEGEILTWDKAIELYDDLREYVEGHPEMADAARRILHRNRNMGVHASGLIISGVPIKDFVPLVKVKNSDGACSAWVEGLHGTDLGAVGLVKFDFLSLDGNHKIADATRIANEMNACRKAVRDASEHVGMVAALPGKGNWSDTSYLNDPVALEMADKGDLKMIFQYDGSEGIRRLARQGGVTSFDDLVMYTALFRPGPMKEKLHDVYCNRKRGKEGYTVHPLLADFMSSTHGVLIFQEQLMRMLNVVGKIPLKDCEDVRKAISKKKVGKFQKYKEIFVTNGQQTLGWSAEELDQLWRQIEAFAGYGFNLAHAVAYTYISSRMLYLKAHHPLAFYSSVLSHTKPCGPKDYLKLKDYRREAEQHGVRVNRIDINKSGDDCKIVDGEIYYGLSKIRGVGDEPAKRLADLRPYQGYEDFLRRAGTDAKVHQALIALRVFPDTDPMRLYKFYEFYKTAERKEADRTKRFNKSLGNYRERLKSLAGSDDVDPKLYEGLDEDRRDEVFAVLKKMTTSVINYERRTAPLPTLAAFQDDDYDGEIDPDYRKLLDDPCAAEEEFYGFVWSHPIEKCRHYANHTFEEFESSQSEVGPIDVQIKKVSQLKGPKATYYSLEVEDATGDTKRVTVWLDDHERFQEELVKGKYVRMVVQAPTKGFNNYTLSTAGTRWRKPPKEMDNRIFPLD